MNDQKEHHPCHCPVRIGADRLAIFRRHAADGEAEAGSAAAPAADADAGARNTGRGPRSRQRRRPRAGAAASATDGAAGAGPGFRTACRAAAHARRPSSRPRRASRSTRRRCSGSIALKGGRIDDLALIKYRETVDPKSPAIVLLSPSGSPHPFYAEFGWVPAAGVTVKLPGRRHGLDAAGIGHARHQPSGDAAFTTTAKGSNSAAPSRSTRIICSRSRTVSRTRDRRRSLFILTR